MTITIQIGNTDDKLSQQDWSKFVARCASLIEAIGIVHFSAGSPNNAPWQNYCWVCAVGGESDAKILAGVLTDVRKQFRQDSIAWTVGETKFV